MVNSQLKCFYCNKSINSKADLITAPYIISVQPYHAHCYSKRINSLESIFLGNKPINGIWGNLAAILYPLAFLWILFSFIENAIYFSNPFILIMGIIVLGIFTLPTFWRIYSYFKYEKPLQ